MRISNCLITGALAWGLLSGASAVLAAPVNPVVHYSFDAGGGSLFNDTSGNAHNGTGASTGTQVGGAPFGAGALQLNGASNFVQMPATVTDALFSSDAATMSMWVRLNVATVNGSLANFGISNSHYPWSDGNGYFGEFRASRVDAVPLGPANRTQWHMITIVNDPTASQWRYYQNGVLQHTVASQAWTLQNNGAGTGRIGVNNAANFIDGAIDEFFLFNQALTATEINNLRLFNQTEEPPPPLAPEPASIALFGLALAGAGAYTWRKRRQGR